MEIRGIEDFVDEHAGIGAEYVSMSEMVYVCVCALYYIYIYIYMSCEPYLLHNAIDGVFLPRSPVP